MLYLLPKDMKVVWSDQWNTVLTFNGQTVIDDKRLSVDRAHDDEWNLRFDKVKYGDQGQYTCQVNTKPPILHIVLLTVIGLPEPTITWYKLPSLDDEEEGDEEEREIVERRRRKKKLERVGEKGEILIIHNVTRKCGGLYQCEANNNFPPIAKRVWDVRVAFEPDVKLANKRLGQSLGKDTVLECVVKGYPQASVFWSFDGRQVGSSTKHKLEILQDNPSQLTLNLHIHNIEPEDYGIYTCSANNAMGKAHRRMTLYEHKGRPRPPPTTPTVSTTSTTSKSTELLPETFKPHSIDRLTPVLPPKGRAGVGHNRHATIDTGYRQGRYNQQQTGPAASKHRNDKNSSPSLAKVPSTVILTVISLCTIFSNNMLGS
ncbi:opioid-binding protein/cell adhesion molecule homolog [Plakobranchus ocellatus]|uniref:Opioid-binding protein/cell adhesion molecule homolog n=1 Tax=Plakobranchus ocellatus TaxID=259542 RepID=A0AAV3Y278_9GAST|nr:opioid-binding protein/cell adhesion molecule homolog [Plakobranchus ocellatus]